MRLQLGHLRRDGVRLAERIAGGFAKVAALGAKGIALLGELREVTVADFGMRATVVGVSPPSFSIAASRVLRARSASRPVMVGRTAQAPPSQETTVRTTRPSCRACGTEPGPRIFVFITALTTSATDGRCCTRRQRSLSLRVRGLRPVTTSSGDWILPADGDSPVSLEFLCETASLRMRRRCG